MTYGKRDFRAGLEGILARNDVGGARPKAVRSRWAMR